MLIFVTSVRHPHNSNNFEKVESIFEMSLRSVCSQTDPNFRVIVVSNVKPRIAYDDPRVIYHIVDFPRPSPKRCATTGINALVRDKGTKLLAGMLLARRFKPDYFAFFDADDTVSRRLAEFVNTTPSTAGWYVDSGYTINYRTWTVQRKSGLVRYCGTTLIPNATELLRLANIDAGLDETATQDELLNRVSHSFIDHIIGNHKYMVRYFANHRLRMRPVPFRAVAWMQETGENHTITTGVRSGVPITEQLCREFGIAIPPVSDRSVSVLDRVREAFNSVRSTAGSIRDRVFGFPEPPCS